MRKQSPQIMSEVQKIWYHVMNILYHARNREVRIPSSYELSEEFGIARSTVRIALERLIAEGYLYSKAGTGTFTNPRKTIFQDECDTPLIGLLLLAGNMFCYPLDLQADLAYLFAELQHSGWNLRLITERMEDGEDVRQVLPHSYLDGLITFGSPEAVVKAASAIVPTVNIATPVKGVPSVFSTHRHSLGKLFELAGRDQDILLWTSFLEDEADNFLARDWTRPGIEILYNTEDNAFAPDSREAALRKAFERRCPDWFVLRPSFLPQVRRIIIELYGEERARKCLWLFAGRRAPDTSWKGYFLQADRRTEARKAIDLLRKRLKGEDWEGLEFKVEAKLIRDDDGTEIK